MTTDSYEPATGCARLSVRADGAGADLGSQFDRVCPAGRQPRSCSATQRSHGYELTAHSRTTGIGQTRLRDGPVPAWLLSTRRSHEARSSSAAAGAPGARPGATAFDLAAGIRRAIAMATKRSPTPCRIRAAADDRNRPEGSAPAGAARRSLSTTSGVRPGRGGVIAMPRTEAPGPDDRTFAWREKRSRR
jgi:hypothetical protein